MSTLHPRRAATLEVAGTTSTPIAKDGEEICWSRARFTIEDDGSHRQVYFIGVCRPGCLMGEDGRTFALFGLHKPHLSSAMYSEISKCSAAVLLTCEGEQGVGYVQKLTRKNGHQHHGGQKNPEVILHLTGEREEYRSVVTDHSSYKKTAPALALAQPA